MANYSTGPSSSAIWVIVGAGVLCAGLIGLAVFLSVRGVGKTSTPTPSAALMSHDTLGSTETTWPPNYANLASTIASLKLPPAGPTILHHHVHLDIEVDGAPVSVPAQIGLSSSAESPLHTHDDTGVIHVESSDTNFAPTLGEVFDVWGVSFSPTNLGGYVTSSDNILTAYVNGQTFVGDPRNIPLDQHSEIFVYYGSPSLLPNPVPSSYTFSADL